MADSKPKPIVIEIATAAATLAALIGPVIAFSLRHARIATDPNYFSYIVAGVIFNLVGIFLLREGLAPPSDGYIFYEAARNRRGVYGMVAAGVALFFGPIVWLVLWLVL